MKGKIIFVLMFVFSVVAFGADDVEMLLMGKESKSSAAVDKSVLKSFDAVVVKSEGQAFVRYDGEQVWKQLIRGDKIKEKSVVITMEDSNITVKLLNGALVELSSKTRASFESLKSDPKKENFTDTEIKVFFGKVYSNVRKTLETGSRYEVKTGSATAGVRGTEFTVWAEQDGKSGIIVYKGTVAFGKNGVPEITLVRQNERVSVDKNGNFGKKENHNEKPPADLPPEEENIDNPQKDGEKPLQDGNMSPKDKIEFKLDNPDLIKEFMGDVDIKAIFVGGKEIKFNKNSIPDLPPIFDNIDKKATLKVTVE